MQQHGPQASADATDRRTTVALIAHDRKKDAIVALAHEFRAVLARCSLCATGTTGARLVQEVGLEVELLLSGPLGGDLQIGARLAMGGVDLVVFLRDPMTPQPHEPDINALVRACDVHDIPCATNARSARMLLRQLAAQLDGAHEAQPGAQGT
ncbi:methylglyoxal synthase [Ramlibacter sp. AN1015]|uniref:methylglyoxal synthase n=1 Tax=Ramlibacter sp. AN1015 TaxID=3133428 RepID=UPI0030C06FA2